MIVHWNRFVPTDSHGMYSACVCESVLRMDSRWWFWETQNIPQRKTQNTPTHTYGLLFNYSLIVSWQNCNFWGHLAFDVYHYRFISCDLRRVLCTVKSFSSSLNCQNFPTDSVYILAGRVNRLHSHRQTVVSPWSSWYSPCLLWEHTAR